MWVKRERGKGNPMLRLGLIDSINDESKEKGLSGKEVPDQADWRRMPMVSSIDPT